VVVMAPVEVDSDYSSKVYPTKLVGRYDSDLHGFWTFLRPSMLVATPEATSPFLSHRLKLHGPLPRYGSWWGILAGVDLSCASVRLPRFPFLSLALPPHPLELSPFSRPTPFHVLWYASLPFLGFLVDSWRGPKGFSSIWLACPRILDESNSRV